MSNKENPSTLTFVLVYPQARVANDAQRAGGSRQHTLGVCTRQTDCEAGGILAHQISLHALSPSNQDSMSEHKSVAGETVTLRGIRFILL